MLYKPIVPRSINIAYFSKDFKGVLVTVKNR